MIFPIIIGIKTAVEYMGKKKIRSLLVEWVSTLISNFRLFFIYDTNTVMPTRKNASVDSINGAPSIAPTPMSFADLRHKRILQL